MALRKRQKTRQAYLSKIKFGFVGQNSRWLGFKTCLM